MADVSVEFGAKDTGLEQTLKTIQDQLVSLDGELKSGTLSFEEINKKMREAAQAEKLHASLGGTKDQIEALGLSFGKSSTQVDKFSQGQKEAEIKISAFAEALGAAASGAMSLDSRLAFVQKNLQELRDKAASAELTAEELEDTLKKIGSLESAERRLKGIGDASSESKPKIEGLADATQDAGQKAQGAGGMFDESFKKIAAAFTIGNIAAQAFEKIVGAAFSAARAVVDGFGQAIDLGGRLDDLSKRTGETAGNLFILEGAFKEAGLSADQVGTTINKLQNFMQDASNGGERQAATMGELGISLEQLAGKTPTQQMEIFAQKIAGIQDPTQRAATASEVFGEKLGGKLLPLLLEFPQTLDNVRDRTGGMADVMDESAATFARAGDTIDAVEGKLTALAAGILSETIPAFDELGRSVEQIDAASLGEEIGSVLNPALRELNSILIDAIREYKEYATVTKAAGEGNYEVATSTGEATGALDLLGTMVASVVGPISDLVNGTTTYIDASNQAAEAAKNGAASIDQVGVSATGVTAPLGEAAAAADSVSTSVQAINSGGAFASINEGATTFKSLIDEGNISLSDMSGEIGGQIPLQTEQIALVGELNTSLGEANEKAGEQLAKIEQQVAAEQARNEKIAERQEKSAADYAQQVAINEALAAGNVTLAEKLQYQREHTQLTEKIMRDTGMSKDEAAQLAVRLLASKDAAAEAAKETERMKGGVAGANEEAKQFKSFVEYMKDQDLGEPIKPLSEKTRDARDEIEAFGDYIGEDLDQMSFPDIAKKLGVDTVGMTGSEQIDAIVDYIKSQIPNAKQEVIDESASKEKVDDVTDYIEGQSPEIVAEVDQAALNDAVSQMQAEITNEFTGGEGGQGGDGQGGQGGTGGQGGDANADVTSLVNLLQPWQQIITTIRDRLPITALG
jgi:hypothetical protein